MTKFHVLFFSFPSLGNLVPVVEFAQRLISHDRRFSATILIISLSQRPILNSYIQSLAGVSADTKFIHLPPPFDLPSPDQYQSSLGYLSLLIEKHKLNAKNAISKIQAESNSVRVAGIFVDMFTTSMIDIANELHIPCYLFFASPASFLGLMFHLPVLETQLATEFINSDDPNEFILPKDSSIELIVPSFVNPLPPSVLPSLVLKRNQDGYTWFLRHASRYSETKGIIINTFQELEPYAIHSISSATPPIYPVGPVIDLAGPVQWHPNRVEQNGIMEWLDGQPPSSVVLLCFGSMGSFSAEQVQEIARGVERAGFRFLWSIREAAAPAPVKGNLLELPAELKDVKEILLPEGFLERTSKIGVVSGWVPQVAVLGHQAIGGFVSHCGWNSILESLWYGVPIATWPLYAEQQMNAFQLVKELGLGFEIRVDYRNKGSNDMVLAEELERVIKRLMEGDDEIRRRVKEMSEKSRMAVREGGSSYASLTSLVDKLTLQT